MATHWTQMPVKNCEVCGGPTRNTIRVCRNSRECKREFWCRNAAAKRGGLAPKQPCVVCQRPTMSKYQVCNATKECRRESSRLSARTMLKRADRRCRNYGACSTLASINSFYCRPCASDANRRHKKARREPLVQLLGERQEWICTWCEQDLPEDLRDVEVDHIIPKSSGLVIEEEWNLQLLHGRCNVRKFDRITVQAIQLAAKHGLNLAA